MISLMLITLMTITLITLIIRIIGAPCLLLTLRSNMDMELGLWLTLGFPKESFVRREQNNYRMQHCVAVAKHCVFPSAR